MNSTEMRLLIDEVNLSNITSFKHNIKELHTILNNPNTTAVQLKQVIETDPSLTAKILKAANSAYYGARHRVGEIKHAIVWLGFDVVRELALSHKVCELFNNTETIFGFSRAELWKHSIAVALCGKLIFRREFRDKGDDIYAAGLMHDLGIIIFDQFRHPEFITILKNYQTADADIAIIEKMIMGFNHAELGKELAWNWGFPVNLVNAIGAHHSPFEVEAEFGKIAKVMYIADYSCQRADLGWVNSKGNDDLYNKCLESLGIKHAAVELIMENVIEEIKRIEKFNIYY